MAATVATDWTEVTAWATIALTVVTLALVVAAIAAARYAKRDIETQLATSDADIDTQLRASKDSIAAQVKTSAAEVDAQLKASEAAIEAQLKVSEAAVAAQMKTSAAAIEAQLKTAADDLSATREATAAAQAAAQRQIEASYRPLLIDVTETTSAKSDLDPQDDVLLTFPGGRQTLANWRHAYVRRDGPQIFVAVPLRNVGNGLAVIERRGVRLDGDRIGAEAVFREVHRERVPPGETTRVLTQYQIAETSDPRDLQLLVPYTDFDGGQRTYADVRLEYLRDEHWRVTSVTPVAPEKLP